jgi:STE24 endopeptidase
MTWLVWAVAAAVLLRLGAQLGLSYLNASAVHQHRHEVPATLQGAMDEASYRRSVEYTLAKNRFGRVVDVWEAFVLAAILFTGLLPALWSGWLQVTGTDAAWSGALFLVVVAIGVSLPALPLDWWAQFRLEARFGFNRSTIRLWVADRLKGLLLSIVIGVPLLWLLLQLVDWIGPLWWAYAWGVFIAFELILIVLYPMIILPWFNTLTPLPEGDLRNRLLALAERARFRASNIQVMDGSRRSGHSNAFFTGFGRFRRIVLFDTLVEQLGASELEAVLAHEIGHYKLGHIPRLLALSALVTLGVFALIGWLAATPAFFAAFGFGASHPAVAFLLFMLISGPVGFWFGPLGNILSRRHEYQADAFARRLAGSPEPMIAALRKLARENLSNLTPHPMFSTFYYSHPTLAEREAALRSA